jgi:hypothetical protein
MLRVNARFSTSLCLAVVAWALAPTVLAATPRAATKQTVCTVTVNSSDEKDAFRRHLSADRYQFVELVERGRPDWLESARQRGIRCDVLIISGHYDGGDYAGGNEFFSEHVDSHEYLPVDEMERVACSDPEDGLFSQLKEVYLFGCNTLNPQALRSDPAEIARTLVQSGHAPGEAERLARALSSRYADSSRDRMRHIFRNVPAIYGFSSVAPLGPVAATYLDRYFQAGGVREIGTGKAGSRLLGYFPGRSLTLARGLADTDSDAGFRRDLCQFVDDRLSPRQKVDAVHQLLRRDMAEVRLFLDRLERYSASLDATARQAPDVAQALDAIARDTDARARYLKFVRNSDRPAVRARMIELAADFNWLSAAERRAELMQMIGDQFAQATVSAADVDLVCRLNEDHALDGGPDRLPVATDDNVGRAAILACLGSEAEHARVLQALVSPREADVQIAQVYLRHHPIDDVNELRDVATGISQMVDSVAQVRALDTLAHHRVADRQTLEALARMYPLAKSVNVQRAIAGILIRSDYRQIATPELVRALQQHRLKSSDGQDLIDVLIRRLQLS